MLYSGNLYSKKLGTIENYYKEFSENKEFSLKSTKNVMKTLKINLLLAFFFKEHSHGPEVFGLHLGCIVYSCVIWASYELSFFSSEIGVQHTTDPSISWHCHED